MDITLAGVRRHEQISEHYRLMEFSCPSIAAAAQPGQFIHVRIPHAEIMALRRPFSIYRADSGAVSIVYKQVGRGTAAMTMVSGGEEVSLLGPLGRGFPCGPGENVPVLVGGGYGVAPLCFLAARMGRKGALFVGGATAADILCIDDFKALGWDIHIATEDGSMGQKGLVTDILDEWLAAREQGEKPEFHACGPDGMLKAVGDRAANGGWTAWLSLDKHMGCGVGACLACVQRIRDDDGTERWGRVCTDGPVFESRQIVW